MNVHAKIVTNLTSFINFRNDSQRYCVNITKEDEHLVHDINISSATICSLIVLTGTAANGYAIWININKVEKTFRAVLVLNLLISGLIWSLFLFLNMVYFACGVNWPFGTFMCQLNNMVFHLSMFSTAFILTLYSIDYCFVVICPFKYNYYRRPYLASVETLVTWVIAFCFSIPYFVFKTTYDCHGMIKCIDKFDDTDMSEVWKHGQQAIGMIAFVIGYFVPILIIFLSFIITGILYHRKKTSQYTPALKMIFTFQTLFGVCWLPYHVFSLIKLSSIISGGNNLHEVAGLAEPLTISLASLSGSIIPFLYIFLNPDKTQFQQKTLDKYCLQQFSLF